LYQPASKQSSKQASKQMVKNPIVSFSPTFFGVTELQNFAEKKSWFC
jgi:hypothetical protein